jgi:predicted DsbA family dithiol-disulfide isomerase
MISHIKIDIVSDVSCPWCIIGYQALQQALQNLSSTVQAEITWQPFELNPKMPAQGQDISEHITQKYGISIEQSQQNREAIKERGLAVGYEFGNREGGRIYNTFDAHRLLFWAQTQGQQTALKLALFDLYFKEGGDPSDHLQLLQVVEKVGLNLETAKQVLDSDQYGAEVRKQQNYYQSMGVNSVPAVIINNKHLLSGGQPVAVFEQALAQIVAETA